MAMFAITHPTATAARGIEDLLLIEKNSKSFAVKASLWTLARLMSVTVFPVFVTLEMVFKRIPKILISIPFFKAHGERTTEKFNKNIQKLQNLALALIFSPLGLRSADAVSGLFLKMTPTPNIVRPFGVEEVYGKAVDHIHYPSTIEEVRQLVLQAKKENKHVSIIGAGMSQGPQTVPKDEHQIVINTKNLKHLEFGPNSKTVKVQAGATWEQIQIEANKLGKSVIVKQASDIFSVGGSIGINCHGWAHEYGAISSTVETLEVIDANGELLTLTPNDELFGCMFGTLGYFGVIVSATLKLTHNEHMVERTAEVSLDEFIDHYKANIKGKNIPLFGGRLVLDTTEANPMRKVYMVKYEKDTEIVAGHAPILTEDFLPEAKYGTRMERIALQAISQVSSFTSSRLISRFWTKEEQFMLSGRKLTRNEALHPPINAFRLAHESKLHTQWLQEYFIVEQHLPNFLRYLGAELKANDVRLINATIRPTPKDNISVLPYAEQERYAVVICFDQMKIKKWMDKTRQWIENVNQYLVSQGDVYYQAYMPYATQEQFEKCYGVETVNKMRTLKIKYDPDNIFSNGHTVKYFDKKEEV